MYHNIKEKSWSVRLVDGYILDNQVRGKNCGNCESVSKIVANNFSNPNLVLYGCNGHKCKHKLIRLKFYSGNLEVPTLTNLFINVRSETANTKF
jgi:hypothetical protein